MTAASARDEFGVSSPAENASKEFEGKDASNSGSDDTVADEEDPWEK